eukprot:TRINITY_DN7512_c0_g1_i3.p1 TRINITY_DN7512_c0_g1~~TRINITY_DN7512_c0_g1_i3.p1  ORF type:complete len:274 (+),score=72.44 TRINITY_DN7512_c0_g1_i3:188-1009(+)
MAPVDASSSQGSSCEDRASDMHRIQPSERLTAAKSRTAAVEGADNAQMDLSSIEGCRQRQPHFRGEMTSNSTAPCSGRIHRCADVAVADDSETTDTVPQRIAASVVDARCATNGENAPQQAAGFVAASSDASASAAQAADDTADGSLSVEYQSFIFPMVLDAASIRSAGENETKVLEKDEEEEEESASSSSSSEEEEESEDDVDEDTDPPSRKDIQEKLAEHWTAAKDRTMDMCGQVFRDPQEAEKWKNRGWKVAQCCGGALLVMALIFDELD